MPLQLDFLTQIINVHWGAEGIFVGADEQGNIYYYEPKSDDSAAFSVGKPFVENTYHTAASAIIDGKPVFVLVGEYVGRDDANDFEGGSGAVIIASRDGKAWSKVFDKPYELHGSIGPPIEAGTEFVTRILYSVVYDATAVVTTPGGATKHGVFYAAGYVLREKWPGSEGTKAGDRMEGEVLYSSQDGFTWSEGAENLIDTSFEPYPEDRPSIIVPHCTKPENEGDVPDGLQGYDRPTETLVGPVGVGVDFTGVFYDDQPPPSRVNIEFKGDAPDEPKHEDVSMPCYAVAHGGQTWLAAGGARTNRIENNTAIADVAVGGAGPWKQIFNEKGKGPIVTMTAQARADSE